MAKIKLLSIKRFLGEKLKLKGFLIQMHFKVIRTKVSNDPRPSGLYGFILNRKGAKIV